MQCKLLTPPQSNDDINAVYDYEYNCMFMQLIIIFYELWEVWWIRIF